VVAASLKKKPALDEVHRRKTREEMLVWIEDPQRIKPGTAMPLIEMTPAQRAEIVDYLMSLASIPAPAASKPQTPAETYE